jgi:hypothetical protein
MEELAVTFVITIYGLIVDRYWMWLNDNEKSDKNVNIYVIGSLHYISLGIRLNQNWHRDR